ncbi:hypothetical protein DH2020_020765 [Rehmannia glutinosa]|uniref:Uncharacterized protein n=1 Tax=Rehmannia glutinosa TaxID=99300 RepID=A0ABR0W5D1_REHGL
MEEKLTLQASSSSRQVPPRQPQDPAAVAVNPPPVQQQLAPVSSKALRPPARPGFGKFGRKIIVKANHFLVAVADRDLNHYDVSAYFDCSGLVLSRKLVICVSISPEVSSKKVCRDIMTQLVDSFQSSHLGKRELAYDGRKSCYTAGELPFTSKDFVVKLIDKDGGASSLVSSGMFLLLTVQKEREFKVSINYTVVGRSFFDPQLGEIGELGNGLQYWKGFYQSLRPTQMGLSLNIDMSARAFFEPLLVSEYVAKFPLEESGGSISVVQYFRQKYNIALKYPFLPALQAGSATRPIYLPMEMVRYNNYDGDQLVKTEFGIQVNPQLTSIEARVLPAPTLRYHATGRQALVDPSVGQWNMIDKKMVNGGKVDFWACTTFSRNLDANRFCSELISMCCSKGMEFNPSPLVPTRLAHSGQIEKALSDIHAESSKKLESMNLTGKQLQLLIIILPDISGSYGKIKRVCETELGIVSQCCQPRQAAKLSKQYMENVALKINVKVGGRNTVMEQVYNKMPYLTDRPTIVFGADVTHPSPGEDSSPSIAAVVASMDWPEVTKYRGLVSAQAHREEIIQDLYNTKQDPKRGTIHGGMIREHLIAFYKSTGIKPHRIIFYRDGVSEGQFNQVLLHEMDAIRKACVSIEATYMPRVTFVVVQKRHHTRLFPATHGDRHTTDRSGNILPGTVVDTKICHPHEFDFYLCSHAGIQGTSRPAHYHVLYDENAFTADALQMLTNSLCYTYARCTRSVSIVPPAYYAHLAAFRARYYIEGTEMSDSGSTAGAVAGATRDRNAEVRPLPVIKENVKDVMFYC